VGKIRKLIIVKLGGSVITNKEKPLTPNLPHIRLISEQLSRAAQSRDQPAVILIHGGGSFGHYFAKEFGLGTDATMSAPAEGLARTGAAMIKLHSIILDEFCRAGVYCGTVLPIELFSKEATEKTISKSGKARLLSIYGNGLVPISFGFVNLVGANSYIVSGDRVALALAATYSVEMTIFVMDVDGVYKGPELTGGIIRRLDPGDDSVESSVRRFDVTGGIKSKINTGHQLAGLGSDVYFVNGTKPQRLFRLLDGADDVLATKIYSRKKSGGQPLEF